MVKDQAKNVQIKNVQLKDIYVGTANGLNEAKNENFISYFYTGNNKYKEFLNNKNKFIISGRKGTGKTILAKYFEAEQNKKNNPSVTLTDRDIELLELIEVGPTKVSSTERSLFIEFSILTQMGKLIIKNKKRLFKITNISKWNKILKKVKFIDNVVNGRTCVENFYKDKYVVDSRETSGCSSGAKLNTKFLTGEGSSDIKSERGVKCEYIKTPYYNQISRLREDIVYLLDYICINVIFDDLDEYDKILTGNQDLIDYFNTFIKVCNNVNSAIQENKKSYSRVILLLRSDMLRPLNNASKNVNKIVTDAQIKLNWIKKVPVSKPHPLMELIAEIIRKSNPVLKDLSYNEIIDRFFPKQINGIYTINYLLNSSFGRPRDIINLLNVVKENNPTANRFSKRNIQAAFGDYSKIFLDDLRNEMSSYLNAEQIEECFDIIRKIKKCEFWLSDIENVFKEMGDNLIYFKTPKQFYTTCYDYGIIGNVVIKETDNKETNGKVKKDYCWKYREDGKETPDEKEKFCLHFALTRRLIR